MAARGGGGPGGGPGKPMPSKVGPAPFAPFQADPCPDPKVPGSSGGPGLGRALPHRCGLLADMLYEGGYGE